MSLRLISCFAKTKNGSQFKFWSQSLVFSESGITNTVGVTYVIGWPIAVVERASTSYSYYVFVALLYYVMSENFCSILLSTKCFNISVIRASLVCMLCYFVAALQWLTADDVSSRRLCCDVTFSRCCYHITSTMLDLLVTKRYSRHFVVTT